MYKLHEDSQYIEKRTGYCIPPDPANSDYQQFIQDVAEQGIGIVEGNEPLPADSE